MKKRLVVGLALLFAISAISVSFAAVKGGKISLKAGDEVYVCGCGEQCDCGTISKKPGKCSCDKDLVKGTVSKVSKGKAIVMVDGKERTFKTTGKFQCPCGPSCDCDTISQKPGKCTCGKDLEAVGKKK